jgi:hypothetical protein
MTFGPGIPTTMATRASQLPTRTACITEKCHGWATECVPGYQLPKGNRCTLSSSQPLEMETIWIETVSNGAYSVAGGTVNGLRQQAAAVLQEAPQLDATLVWTPTGKQEGRLFVTCTGW